MYNVNIGMVPSYIQDLIPPLVSEISDYPLSNNRNISVPLNRTSISQKSCIPSAIRLWNPLDDNLKDISTLPTFKKHIFSKLSIAHVPPYFTVGNRYRRMAENGFAPPPPREFCRHILSCRKLKAESFKRCLHSVLRGVSL